MLIIVDSYQVKPASSSTTKKPLEIRIREAGRVPGASPIDPKTLPKKDSCKKFVVPKMRGSNNGSMLSALKQSVKNFATDVVDDIKDLFSSSKLKIPPGMEVKEICRTEGFVDHDSSSVVHDVDLGGGKGGKAKGEEKHVQYRKIQIEEPGLVPGFFRAYTQKNCNKNHSGGGGGASSGGNSVVVLPDPETGKLRRGGPAQAAMPFRCYPLVRLNPEGQDRAKFKKRDYGEGNAEDVNLNFY